MAPALCGPTRNPPPSIQAMDPPPAPIVCILTIADKIGNFSIFDSEVMSGSPLITILTSKLVPPISIQIRFSFLMLCPNFRLPMVPPTGPDNKV